MATVRMPSSRHAEITRSAISPRLAMRIFLNIVPRLRGEANGEELFAVLDGLAVAGIDRDDFALDVRLDLVHQLHRFDDAEDLALADPLSDLGERVGLGGGGTVKRPDDRRRDHVDVLVLRGLGTGGRLGPTGRGRRRRG